MTTFVRLRDTSTGRSIIAEPEAGKAWADLDGDGRISKTEPLVGADAQRAAAAAQQVQTLFVDAIPGNTVADGAFEVRGRVSPKEAQAFDAVESIPAERAGLALHLDFYDANRDGKLSISESLRGFRAQGFSTLDGGVKALAANLLFGRPTEGFAVDIDAVAKGKRRSGASGIYDAAGRIDEAKLQEYLAVFEAKGGTLTHDEVIALLREKGAGGLVSKNQFKSLFSVTKRLNGDETVTAAQFRAQFDGSLPWMASAVFAARR